MKNTITIIITLLILALIGSIYYASGIIECVGGGTKWVRPDLKGEIGCFTIPPGEK